MGRSLALSIDRCPVDRPRRSIDGPSIDRRASDRSPGRRSRRVRVFSRCRAAVRPRRDRADATRARAHTAARGALTTVRSRRRSRRASASRATRGVARDDDDDANRDADGRYPPRLRGAPPYADAARDDGARRRRGRRRGRVRRRWTRGRATTGVAASRGVARERGSVRAPTDECRFETVF